jgi:hypothetical protein
MNKYFALYLFVLICAVAAVYAADRRITAVTFSDGTTQPVDPAKLPAGVVKAIEDAKPAEAVPIKVLRSGTMAPAHVSVAAVLPADNRHWDCVWDFGDAGATPVTHGITGQKVNPSAGVIRGRSAHFVYERAGTYTITLRAKSPTGDIFASSIVVPVKADTRRLVKIDPANADRQLATLSKSIEPVHAVFDGQYKLTVSFDLPTNEFWASSTTGTVISAPLDVKIFTFGKQPRNWVISDSVFDGERQSAKNTDSHGTAVASSVRGQNGTFLRVHAKTGINTFIKEMPINARGGGAFGTLAWACSSEKLGDEFFYLGGVEGGIYFCDATGGSESENFIRNSETLANRWTAFGNRIANYNGKGGFNWRAGSDSDFIENNVSGGGARWGAGTGACDNNVIRDNVIVPQLQVWRPLTNSLFEHNTIRDGYISVTGGGTAAGVEIIGNTMIGSKDNTLKVPLRTFGAAASEIRQSGNVWRDK